MNLDDLAKLGEVIGAVAVVVSLIYLAIQVKQSNSIARANAYRDFHQDIGAVLKPISTDAALYRIWSKALYSGEELSEEEKDRLGMLLFQLFGALNGGYQSSWLDPSIKDYVEIMTDLQLKHEHVRGWWVRQRSLHPMPFRAYVDGRLAELEFAAPHSG